MLLLALGCALITKDDYDTRTGSCDEPSTWYEDGDGDGFGADAQVVEACSQPEGHVAVGGDCDDNSSGINPEANEICNGASDDCDPEVDENAIDTLAYAPDLDEDGFPDLDEQDSFCPGSEPADWIDVIAGEEGDCDDGDDDVHPGADEYCNEEDDDCDGEVDEEALDGPTWYADADGDDYGDPESPVVACTAPSSTADNDLDCDDSAEDMNPDEEEVCGDGIDNDCDGLGCRISGAVGVQGKSSAILFGLKASERAGASLAGAGDVDRDGAEDFLVGAPFALDNERGTYPGRAYLVLGPVTTGQAELGTIAATTLALDTHDDASLGHCLGGGEDLMAEGAPTLVLCAPLADGRSGAVYLLDSSGLGSSEDPSDGVTIEGAFESGYFGSALGLADLDGDGQEDLAIGGSNTGVNGASSGSVYTFLGPITADADATDTTGHYKGKTSSELGGSLATGDLDGDGLAEVAIGAPGMSGAAGTVAFFYGPTSAGNILTSDADFRVMGKTQGDGLHVTTRSGDWLGNGTPTLLLGAPGVQHGDYESAGAVYLLEHPSL